MRTLEKPKLWRHANSAIVEGSVLAVLASSFCGLVWIYGNSLRDPRFLDGWILAGGMSLQLCFHFLLKAKKLSPKATARWRSVHVCTGYFLIAALVSHSSMSMPDTGIEWALWATFVLITLSGILGAYLSWSLKQNRDTRTSSSNERIRARQGELAREVWEMVAKTHAGATVGGLPPPPEDAWVSSLYEYHLKDYFAVRRGPVSWLGRNIGPAVLEEIDELALYANPQNQERLEAIKSMVVERRQLDSASRRAVLTQAWQFVHVPLTYALVVLIVVHVVVVYAFSSGSW